MPVKTSAGLPPLAEPAGHSDLRLAARQPKMDMVCAQEKYYRVYLQSDLFGADTAPLSSALRDHSVFVVTTPSVDRLFGRNFRDFLDRHRIHATYKVVACTEATKTIDTVSRICLLAQAAKLDRRAVMVSFGGGSCCDIVTMAASMLRRGIAHIRIPTTLIGQVDAGIAVKGAVNFGPSKNYLGCFFPPSAVFVDPSFLRTLNATAIRQGLAEIIKMAILKDAALFEAVSRYCNILLATRFAQPSGVAVEIIEQSIALMLEELQENPYESGRFDRWVDFGHTFSPQLEAASGFTLPHGEAVAVDTALSAFIATELGLLPPASLDRILRLLAKAELPLYSPLLTPQLCLQALDAANLHRGGSVNLVVPTDVGAATFLRNKSDVPQPVLAKAIDRLSDWPR